MLRLKMPPKKESKLLVGQSVLSFGREDVQPDKSTGTTDSDRPSTSADSESGESTATVSSTTGTEEKEPSKQGKLLKFQEKWKLFHPWLIYQDGAMFCQICISGRCRNAFTQGSKNFKASALNEHLSGKDHKSALVVPREQENKKVEKKLLTEKEKGVVLRLKVILWLGFVLNVW